jgi:hypothetical protein
MRSSKRALSIARHGRTSANIRLREKHVYGFLSLGFVQSACAIHIGGSKYVGIGPDDNLVFEQAGRVEGRVDPFAARGLVGFGRIC